LPGLGVADDIQRAKQYLEKLNASIRGDAPLAALENQQHEISVLQRTIEELKAKLDGSGDKPRRGRPRKDITVDEAFVP
jgi:plasmid stabilization system protein ParE